MNRDQLKAWWDYIQSLFDLDGDLWMGLLTAVYVYRILAVVWGQPPITLAEGGIYSVAVGAFAYSNRGPRV